MNDARMTVDDDWGVLIKSKRLLHVLEGLKKEDVMIRDTIRRTHAQQSFNKGVICVSEEY
jgi:hypothetical protein